MKILYDEKYAIIDLSIQEVVFVGGKEETESVLLHFLDNQATHVFNNWGVAKIVPLKAPSDVKLLLA